MKRGTTSARGPVRVRGDIITAAGMLAVALSLLGACVFAPAHGAALPSASIYQLDVELTDQNGRTFRLADLRGEPVLISMFYSSCEMVCIPARNEIA